VWLVVWYDPTLEGQRYNSAMVGVQMADELDQELEDFIQDWHWDEKSHKFAQELGTYLFQFIDHLHEQGLSSKTLREHTKNCWCAGIAECQYGYNDKFVPGDVFYSPDAGYEHVFKRKMSDSQYAVKSYRSTWRKLYKYTKALGHLNDD